ncbi:molybdate transport system substrate-binding protein [Cohaesibacter sp. ES.047]|uniref:molybdate ABC transporter substrate-binding protein n=1 Tax=Cohaesibacter sp. ES.047 TaxID=1798205 RepID=UPI000BB9B65B|nr:molybdate ABC transporter substrate-binding protein [Cohaesibacter sp. ES.047]SNY91669.1 molybdate transport system substrate-binding protein [Cohaesibacter sp. ES.047]
MSSLLNKPALWSLIALALSPLVAPQSEAAETKIAVAANFTSAAKEIAAAFKDETGHDAKLSFGSTGKLFAQIVNGAPFTVFLAADQARPIKAEQEGAAVAGSRFTYATGRIVLFSQDAELVDGEGAVLQSPDRFDRLAIANPATAPYGAAAMEVIEALAVPVATQDKIVRGDSISQTHQFVASGNAQLGFLALSQVINLDQGSQWVVPTALYTPIRQDAVLLKTGADDEAAKAFMIFLKGDRAKDIIRSFGYGVE